MTNIESILGKAKATSVDAETRRAFVLEYVEQNMDTESDAESVLAQLVDDVQSGDVDDKHIESFIENINASQIKKFKKEYNERFSVASDVKMDDARASAVSYAETLVDRESAKAEEALDALKENVDDADDATKHFVANAIQNESKRQLRRFGRDWRREQSNPERSTTRVNRFDSFEAKLDEMQATIKELTNAINKLQS